MVPDADSPLEGFRRITKGAGERLRPFGFKGRAGVFRRMEHGNCAVIQLQRSMTNSKSRCMFTVNLGVVYGVLFDGEPKELESATEMRAHLRLRLGSLLPAASDKWWAIEEGTDVPDLEREVNGAITELGVPFLRRYMTIDAITSLWQSGRSPGMTEVYRLRLLEKLKKLRSTPSD